MHRCLHIPEIFSLICTHCRRADAVALARTCRAFYEPAHDRIWAHLEDLKPLIMCMPEDLWQNSNEEDLFQDFVFQRPILPSDWSGFEKHARRVRSIASCTHSYLDRADFYSLTVSAAGRTLFPKLQEIDWSDTSSGHVADTFAFVVPFLGPHLLHVKLFARTMPIALLQLAVVVTLPARCPYLKTLAVNHYEMCMSAASASVLSTAICSFSYLESATVCDISFTAFRHLASLPTLTSLLLRLNIENFTDTDTDLLAFPALRDFCLYSSLKISSCARLIDRMGCSNLQLLDIECREGVSQGDWPALISAIHRRVPASTLTSLSIRNTTQSGLELALWDAQAEHTPQTFSDIQPLLAFPRLTFLCLEAVRGFDLDDAAVAALARALPCLRTLRIEGVSVRHNPRTTAQSLLALAEGCAHLDTLGINVDARIAPPGLGMRRTRHTALRTLHVDVSPLQDASRFARFLSGVFPCLGAVQYGRVNDYEKGWTQVQKLYRAFVDVRAEEAIFLREDAAAVACDVP
ncbi:hypothetical protein H0H81_004578 [Sphagnurus paluster]|uniref:F-box domain-containing protein n=1 Tax=Sphagnurus paluster TaxID=117069 RepID=A0A9P7KGA5_9AGAR|nr:hypothetical protein H0H81_004578 [Sphagnurus paluster]